MAAPSPARRLPLSELTPTAAFVATVLDEADEPLSRAAVERRTGAPRSSVRDALASLRERDLVTVTRRPREPNVPRYALTR